MEQINKLIERGCIDTALYLANGMEETKRQEAFSLILNFCLNNASYKDAQKTTKFMGRKLCIPEKAVLINGCLKNGNPEQALTIINEMTKADRKYGEKILLHCYIIFGYLAQAHQLARTMNVRLEDDDLADIFKKQITLNRYEVARKSADLMSKEKRITFLESLIAKFIKIGYIVEAKKTILLLKRELSDDELETCLINNLRFNNFPQVLSILELMSPVRKLKCIDTAIEIYIDAANLDLASIMATDIRKQKLTNIELIILLDRCKAKGAYSDAEIIQAKFFGQRFTDDDLLLITRNALNHKLDSEAKNAAKKIKGEKRIEALRLIMEFYLNNNTDDQADDIAEEINKITLRKKNKK